MNNPCYIVLKTGQNKSCLILTEKVVLASKTWFQPANSMWSTRLIVKIQNHWNCAFLISSRKAERGLVKHEKWVRQFHSSFHTKIGRIGVPIRGLSSRRFSNHWYLSRVEARYWKPKIVVTGIPISSLIQICSITNMLSGILICVRTFLSKYSHMLNEIDQTWITNCKSPLWMCKLIILK